MSKNIIKRGSKGPLVKEAQSVLSVIYPELTVDGIFGLQTQNVVKKFQSSRKLVADGIIGPMTWGEMYLGETPIKYKPTEPKPVEVSPGLVYDESVKMKTKGSRPKGLLGLIVHFTAGWSTQGDRNMVDTLNWGIESGYTFWGIARSGRIYKTHDETKWGSHAGTSYWPGIGNNVSQHLLGVEIACAGQVVKTKDGRFKASSFSETFDPEMVRTTKAISNIKAGTYLKFSDEQFESLVQICFDMKRKHETFSFDYVLGHDEVCVPLDRKNDPGASLPMTMSEFRAYLNDRWKSEK